MSRGEPELVTGFWASPVKARSRWPLVRQPGRDCSRQLKCDQLLTWPSDQPRHATCASGYPVESSSPPSGLGGGRCGSATSFHRPFYAGTCGEDREERDGTYRTYGTYTSHASH